MLERQIHFNEKRLHMQAFFIEYLIASSIDCLRWRKDSFGW